MFSKKKKKTMKKIITLFVVFFIGILSAKAGYSFSYTYQGKTLYYEITSSTTVRVTYATYDSNYVSGNVTIPSQIKKATYHNTQTYSVTSIGVSAFSGCSSLTSITIPNSVTSIGNWAFSDCSSLTSITIPNSVTSIDSYAFKGCSSLTSITIPNSVTSIDSYAFSGCSSLTSITIPNSVTSIDDYAFYGCSSLTSITIPNSVTKIGSYAFSGCSSLDTVTINSNSVCKKFWGGYLDTITKPRILIIGNSVTSIGDGAFKDCTSLTSITIPKFVDSIGNYAFSNCNSLTSIIVKFANTRYDSRDNCNAIIETTTNTLIVGCKNTIIPNTVTSIGNSAFSGCSGLTSITIPNSVTKIDSKAFYNCNSLDTVTINSNSVCNKFWGGYLDTITKPRILIIGNSVTSIGNSAFSGCGSLTSITIPNSVTSIGYLAFSDCSSLTSITIPNSVISIGSYAFFSCSSLTSITIPNSVTAIYGETFYGCKSLRIIELPASLNNIGSSAFCYCSKIHTIYSQNAAPPIIDNSSTFRDVSRSAKLYVPNGSVEAYKQANIWKEFYNIEESDFANIDNVGIQDIDISSTISLYPNPADKEVYLTLDNTDLGNAEAVIYDIQGKVVKVFEIKESENNVKLDISSLASGTYTIMISNDKTKVTKKLIKR